MVIKEVYFYYKPNTCVLFFKKVALYPMLCPFLVLAYKKEIWISVFAKLLVEYHLHTNSTVKE